MKPKGNINNYIHLSDSPRLICCINWSHWICLLSHNIRRGRHIIIIIIVRLSSNRYNNRRVAKRETSNERKTNLIIESFWVSIKFWCIALHWDQRMSLKEMTGTGSTNDIRLIHLRHYHIYEREVFRWRSIRFAYCTQYSVALLVLRLLSVCIRFSLVFFFFLQYVYE